MNTPDDIIREQLSAWMDGELPAEEARFLERRLAGDPDLRRQYERMQLASSCLKGQALRPMPAALAQGIANSLQQSPAASKNSGLIRWSVAASVAALALFLAPGLLRNDGRGSSEQGNSENVAQVSMAPANLVASPASADLIAMPAATAPAVAMTESSIAASPVPTSMAPSVLVAGTAASREESPLPLDSQSPADFPLVETALPKSWPRSPLATGSDPAMEAYLVRHNQMMGNDSLGGFMPYVDVVTSEKEQDAGDSDGAAGR